MGIDNVDAAAFMVAGALIFTHFFKEGTTLAFNLETGLILLGAVLLGFGVLDVAVDSL